MSSAIALPRRRVLADLIPGSWARDAVLVGVGAGLTGLAAQVSVHTSLSPVPFTLQTLAVLVVGAALGSARGVLAMLLYLVAGGLGLPWFASQGHGWGGATSATSSALSSRPVWSGCWPNATPTGTCSPPR